jgi:hypothetical protein
MQDTEKTKNAGEVELSLHEIDEDIKHVAAAFKARLTKRKNKGPKVLGERPLEYEHKNAAMEAWVDAFEYLRELLNAKYGIGEGDQ